MTRLDAPAYLTHLARDSARFREVLAEVDPATRVPACPDWDAGDLLWHLAEVQGFWAGVVEGRPDEPVEVGPRRPEGHDRLLAAFDDASGRLLSALDGVDPTEHAWHWCPEQTVGATFRRQAHEALVHRIDAEQTAGSPTAVDPALAADGVAEALDWMYGGEAPAWGRIEHGDRFVRIRLVDTRTDLWAEPCTFLGTHPERGTVHDGPHVLLVGDPGREADATVTGTAGDVDAWLWKRDDGAGVRQAGDPVALAAFAAAVGPPIT